MRNKWKLWHKNPSFYFISLSSVFGIDFYLENSRLGTAKYIDSEHGRFRKTTACSTENNYKWL